MEGWDHALFSGEESQLSYVCFKLRWNAEERVRVESFLLQYFEETADWSNAIEEMGLTFVPAKPYPRLMATGDFYMDADLRIDHFALNCQGQVVLVTKNAGEGPQYFQLAE